MENTSGAYSYDTLSEAVNDLQKRGYTEDFLISEEEECLICHSHSLKLSHDDFVIDEIYRFEGMTDPGDESIVFALSSDKYAVKGLVVNGFGANFGYRASKLVEDLSKRED